MTDALWRSERLHDEAERLEGKPFRSDVPRAFAQLIRGVAQIVRREIVSEWEAYGRQRDPEGLRQIQTLDALNRRSANYLRYLHGSTADRVPGTLSRALDRLSKMLGLRAQLLLREKWRYNYSVEVEALTEAYRETLSAIISDEELEAFFSEFEPPFHSIAFPAIERESVLLHAALGHELGHVFSERWIKDDENAPEVGDQLKQAVQGLLDNNPREPLLQRQAHLAGVDHLRKIRRRLLQEYTADLVGVELFGPAFVFAMASIARSQSEDLDRPPSAEEDYYPSWRSRIKNAGDALMETGWLPLPEPPKGLEAEILNVSSCLKDICDLGNAEPSSFHAHRQTSVADELARSRLPQFRAYMLSKFVQYPERNKLVLDAYPLVERLDLKLPPNDASSSPRKQRPPELASILNAGWFYRVGWVEHDDRGHDFILERLAILNRLVQKAIEDVVLIEDYRTWAAPT